MLYPGTISLREQTFEALLTDSAESFRTHGFRHVIFVSDSGGNVTEMTAVAKQLAKKWKGSDTTIHYIAEDYDYADVRRFLDAEGIEQVDEDYHDDVVMSSQVIVADPMTVRMPQRIAKGRRRSMASIWLHRMARRSARR